MPPAALTLRALITRRRCCQRQGAGGRRIANGCTSSSAELYDPATGPGSHGQPQHRARQVTRRRCCPTARCWWPGVINSGGSTSAELYDPASGTWSATVNLTPHAFHTATLLPNGKVLVAGGGETAVSPEHRGTVRPRHGTWTATGSLTTARDWHTATLLPNGKVLVAGGYDSGTVLTSAELYDPASGTWSATGNLTTARTYHTATLLPNGKVLVAGGTNGVLLAARNCTTRPREPGLPRAA